MKVEVKRKGITPEKMIELERKRFGERILETTKQLTRERYTRTGYLANGLTHKETVTGGEIHAPDGRLEAPQTRQGFLDAIWDQLLERMK